MSRIEDFKDEVFRWAEHLGVKPKEIHVRKMRRKWASCSTNGRLTFSHDIMKEDFENKHKIIVHELLHLKYPNHGKMFKALLNSYISKIEQRQLPFDGS